MEKKNGGVRYIFEDGTEEVLYFDKNGEIRFDENGNEVSEDHIVDLLTKAVKMVFVD